MLDLRGGGLIVDVFSDERLGEITLGLTAQPDQGREV